MKKIYIGKTGQLILNGSKLKNGDIIEFNDCSLNNLFKNKCYFKDIESEDKIIYKNNKKKNKRGKKL